MFFKTKHFSAQKKRQRALESVANSKRRPFSCLYHTLLKSLRVACTLNIIIRPYLNINAEQMKGVGMGFGYFYFVSELEYIGAGTGTDDLSKIKTAKHRKLLCIVVPLPSCFFFFFFRCVLVKPGKISQRWQLTQYLHNCL